MSMANPGRRAGGIGLGPDATGLASSGPDRPTPCCRCGGPARVGAPTRMCRGAAGQPVTWRLCHTCSAYEATLNPDDIIISDAISCAVVPGYAPRILEALDALAAVGRPLRCPELINGAETFAAHYPGLSAGHPQSRWAHLSTQALAGLADLLDEIAHEITGDRIGTP
ncbi:hypothetical protein ACODT5_28910 [Streptomyces sp. 5.8]|uniref:hypothetical protein n=1 Tax=Streptomyces sp. 5.8 TaxID=3406571 RepID=UPI003BB7F0F2